MAGSSAATLVARLLGASLAVSTQAVGQQPASDWQVYGRDAGGTRYSPLTQITRENVNKLVPAWTFNTGEIGVNTGGNRSPQLEVTPLVVSGTMYLSTPLGRVYALDAATGATKWKYDAEVDATKGYGDFASRGVAYWRAPAGSTAGGIVRACEQRIFVATIDTRLTALDATTGAKCPDFGDKGSIDLRKGLRIPPFEFQAYEMTSPPTIVRDLIITGSAVSDNARPGTPSGEVRAWDVRTGALKWTFDPIPRDASNPLFITSWLDSSAARTGAANVWSVIVADPARDLIFLPTSSPAPDYFGGLRVGDNRYANSLVALQASTGKVVWHFQTVHHDLWDYDNAAPPALVMIRGIPAVLQATKSGMLFAFNRETGKPIFPVSEMPVLATDVPGETTWNTQPYSLQLVRAAELATAWGPTDEDHSWCRVQMNSLLKLPDEFVPPSLRGTLVIPSNIGGAHWGGVAVDEDRGLAIVPVNRLAAMVQLFPADRFNRDSLRRDDAAKGIDDFEYTRMEGTPYIMRRRILRGPSGLPCTPPPFGTLIGVDLRGARIAWQVPLGNMPLPAGAHDPGKGELGSPNLGGPIVTATGVAFIGATIDRQFRAFDVSNGKQLWSTGLPAGARATPMTYAAGGRQFVAIAAGGGGPFGEGDAIIAFALPK